MTYFDRNNMNGTDGREIFQSSDVSRILHNRFVVIIGDSIQRGIYKDLVLLLQKDRYLSQSELKAKGEFSFLDDELIEGGRKELMTNGIAYREVRQYKTDVILVRFYFVTRCYNAYMESILKDLQEEPLPDILIMNSCLWDMTRYGKKAIIEYKENLVTLFTRFSQSLPSSCLVIWNTTLPISSSARGGFLVPEIEYLTSTLRLDILEANYYAQKVAVEHGFDVLDLHFYLRHNLQWRVQDGIHWDMQAHRLISNLILSHICEAWAIPMPRKKPVTFASYGSAAARNGYYQQFYQSPQPLFPYYQFTSNVNYIDFENFNGPVEKRFPQHLSGAIMNGSGQNSVQNANWQQFHWQPYQQNASSGYETVDFRSRHNPYSRRRKR